jgi:hypothetical protein
MLAGCCFRGADDPKMNERTLLALQLSESSISIQFFFNNVLETIVVCESNSEVQAVLLLAIMSSLWPRLDCS